MNKRKRTKLLNDMVDDNEIELALEGDVPIYVHKKHITVPKEVEEFEEPIYRYEINLCCGTISKLPLV